MSGRDQTSVVTRVLGFLKDHFKISLFLIFNSILPLTDVVTDSCACASVAMTAFQNVLKDEDKKTELELTKPAILWSDEDKFRRKEEDKKRQEREEKRAKAAERVLELAKVRLTEEAEVSKQLSKLKYMLDLEGNKQLKETLKKNKSIPQNIKKALGV